MQTPCGSSCVRTSTFTWTRTSAPRSTRTRPVITQCRPGDINRGKRATAPALPTRIDTHTHTHTILLRNHQVKEKCPRFRLDNRETQKIFQPIYTHICTGKLVYFPFDAYSFLYFLYAELLFSWWCAQSNGQTSTVLCVNTKEVARCLRLYSPLCPDFPRRDATSYTLDED